MRLRDLLFILLCSAGVVAVAADQNGSAQSALEAARKTAVLDGDLAAAVKQYQAIVERHATTDRAGAAEALVQVAGLHEKLGQSADARRAHERVVREYGAQEKFASVSRAWLAAQPMASGGAPARMRSDWSVWAGRGVDGFGTISPDGRFLTYTDWGNGASLALRDLTTGTNHRLTSGGTTQFSAISRDGKLVAYEWWDGESPTPASPFELRIARLNGTSITDRRPLYRNDDVGGAAPLDWSPDGKLIAVAVRRRDGQRQIGLISVQDGSLHVLKSIDWREPTKIFFSPDGRHIAYDLVLTDSSEDRHVFVMAIDGSREATVVADPNQNTIMGWSPDGQHVLFSSNRSGSFGLWAVAVNDGRATAEPVLVKADVSSSWSLGLSSTGTMYVWKYASPVYIQASSIDLATGKLGAGPALFRRFIASRGRPEWSADGKHLAYQSCDPLGAGPCTLWIRSMETGQLRELKPKLGYFAFVRWSPDGRELLTRGRDMRGRNMGVYRIDVQTGEATRVPSFNGMGLPQWAADSKHAHFFRDSAVMERDLASGVERELVRIPTAGVVQIAVSPDGRHVTYQTRQGGVQEVFVMPLAGGAPRSVLRLSAPEHLEGRVEWTANGTALILAKEVAAGGRRELWVVNVADGKARKLDVDVESWMIEDGFRVDPAGKQIAFIASAGQPGLEIRALENFLPAPTAVRKGSAK